MSGDGVQPDSGLKIEDISEAHYTLGSMAIARTVLLVCCFSLANAAFGQVVTISEQQALARAAELLKSDCVAPVECEFSTVRVKNGWFITAVFCFRNAKGQCDYKIGGGGHRAVQINDDGTHKYVVGA